MDGRETDRAFLDREVERFNRRIGTIGDETKSALPLGPSAGQAVGGGTSAQRINVRGMIESIALTHRRRAVQIERLLGSLPMEMSYDAEMALYELITSPRGF